MQKDKDVSCLVSADTPRWRKAVHYNPQGPILALGIILALVTLACALAGSTPRPASKRILIQNRLPTLTPTALPALTPVAISPPMAAAPPAAPTSPPPLPPPTFAPAESDPAAFTSPVNQNSSNPILTTRVGLNVRAGPGVNYPAIGHLAQGQSAQIIGKNPEGTWWQIIYPPGSSSLAWVSASTEYSTVSNVEAVAIAQILPPPPPAAQPSNDPTAQPPGNPTTQPSGNPAAQPTQAPAPNGTPIAQLPSTPLPTTNSPVQPVASPASGSPGWDFASVRVYPNQNEESVVLYGNIVNNTGSSQELISITGTFYDAQGQVVAGPDNTHAYWPGYVVAPGGNVPFELFVTGTSNIANFELIAEAEPTNENPRQDFEFADVGQGNEDGAYCLDGELRIRGDEPNDYLIIAAILYDGQGNVINFGDYSEFGVDDSEVDFEICINPPNQEVARYELRAWGL